MNDILKEQIKQLQTIIILRERNELLMDNLVNLLSKTINYCHKHNIPIENELSIKYMIHESRKLLNTISPTESQHFSNLSKTTENQQRNKTTDDETEPKFFKKGFAISYNSL